MMKQHKLGLVALIETRELSIKMETILTKSYLTDFMAVEACGFVEVYSWAGIKLWLISN